MIKYTHALKPNTYAYQELLIKFADGIPLSCEQLNFLAWHEKTLSNPRLDPVFKYYLKHNNHRHTEDHSFLLPNETLTKDDVARLKRRLTLLLSEDNSHIELKMTPEKFLHFRALTTSELILYHGNQLLTGAPFIQGGIPQLILFQWGNLFGVAKPVVLEEELALNSNVLIYFEAMHERLLKECVYEYTKRVHDELQNQLTLKPVLQPLPQQKHEEQLVLNYNSPFTIPTLSLSPTKQEHEKES